MKAACLDADWGLGGAADDKDGSSGREDCNGEL